MEMILWFG